VSLVELLISDELDRILKEAVVAYSKQYARISLKGLKKTWRDCVPSEIRSEDLPDAILERYLCARELVTPVITAQNRRPICLSL
jgi:hypothetical protein